MAGKRGNNEGSVRFLEKKNLWEGRYTAGYKADGKLNQKSVYAASREEANKKMQDAISQVQRGEYIEPSQITLGEWLDTWFQVYGRPRWRESTAAEHYRNIQGNLKPILGKHHIQKLRPEHVQAYINKQIKDGYAPTSIRKQMEPLKSALK